MDEPNITAPGGPLAALLTGLALLAGGLAEWLRRRMKKQPSQLDRMEAMLGTLTRALVVETEDGGRVAKSQRVAEAVLRDIGGKLDGLAVRLEAVERNCKRSPASADRLGDLSRNVESLSAAVQSALDLLERRGNA